MGSRALDLRRVGWTLLLSLLVVTLIGAFTYDRSDWPAVVPGEATLLMQADSLAFDFDLAFERRDYDRSLLASGANPADLELTSADGRRITYDRPFPYALWLAPFVRLLPGRGFAVANALLLWLTALAAVLVVERQVGAAAALLIAVFLFASVSFGYVFLATEDLFLMAVTVLAFSLVVSTHPPTPEVERERLQSSDPGRLIYGMADMAAAAVARRWLVAGMLLAVLVVSEPLYTPLALAPLVAVPRGVGGARSMYVLGFALMCSLQLAVLWLAGGAWLLSADGAFRFTPETGFPLVDFPASEWSSTVRRLKALHWDGAPRFAWGIDGFLAFWNLVYFFIGRNFGILVYFMPLLLLLVWGTFESYRRVLVIAVAIWTAALLVLHPFNLHGGEGAIANRMFLPIYGALWLVLGRPLRSSRSAIVAVGFVGLMAAPFLWRLWSAPWAYPLGSGRGYSYVTSVAQSFLPFETSQRRLPGSRLVEHNGLWLRLIDDGIWAEGRRQRLMLDSAAGAELQIVSPERLDVIRLDFGAEAPSQIEVEHGELGERLLLPSGGISFRIVPRGVAPRHPMWWTPKRQWVYRLILRFPRSETDVLPFQLFGERQAA